MALRDRNLTAEVESVDVVTELRNNQRSVKKIVAGIEGVVTEELPSLAVILLGSGLDHGANLRRRGQAVFRAVVRRHVTELSERIDGGHDAAAAAAAIQVLAAVNQLKIVAGALAVDADGAVTADGGEGNLGHLKARCARSQGKQLIKAAAVGSKLSDLLPGDDVAHLAAVSLHCNSIGFDRYLLLSTAQLQLEVNTGPITDVEGNALLLGDLEPGCRHSHRVVSNVEVGRYVLAVAIAGEGAGDAGVIVSDRNARIGNGGTGGVGDCTDNGCFLGERRYSERRQEEDEQGRETRNLASSCD